MTFKIVLDLLEKHIMSSSPSPLLPSSSPSPSSSSSVTASSPKAQQVKQKKTTASSSSPTKMQLQKDESHRLKNYCVIIMNRKNYWITQSDNTGSSGRHLSHDGKVGFSSHAEMNALRILFSERFRSSKLRGLRNIKLFSIRAKIDKTTQQFQIANAKPCLRCILMLTKWNISKIYYSNDDGDIVSCEDSEISSDEEIHRNFSLSSGDRNGPDGPLVC